ncbi:MAG: putative family peptidase [Gemmatimonadetes bacterium]|nr:putative family peptidase [Gemmatimonadota bacterium]
MSLRRLIPCLLVLALAPAVGNAQLRPARLSRSARDSTIPIDTARARLLYVGVRKEELPQGDFEALARAKVVTDSIQRARLAGIVDYRHVTYRSSDALEIPAYLFQPLPGAKVTKHAALVWVHGGVHGDWNETMLPFVIEAVKRGYVVITPDYRGSAGYGKEFYNAIDYGGREVDDVIASAAYLKTLPQVDTGRVGIMGWSHGAYIAALAVMREQHPFRSAATVVPVTNLVFRLSWKGPVYAQDFAAEPTIGGLPFEKHAEYVARSPLYQVDRLQVPLMVHFATNDSNVNWEEAQQLVDALRARKPKLAEVKVYTNPPPGDDGAGHSFSRRVDKVTLLRNDSPEQVDSWKLTWAFFEKTLAARKPGA